MTDLLACPFCGAGETRIKRNQHWTGMRNQLLSVEIMHWCPRPEGVPQSLLRVVGKTDEDAAERWNHRSLPPASQADEALSAEEIDAEFAAWWSSNWQRLAGIKPIHIAHEAWKHQAKRAMPAGGAGAVPVGWRYRYIFEDETRGHWHYVESLTPTERPRPDLEQQPLYASPIGAGERETVERCAKVCEDESRGAVDASDELACKACAAAIRNLSATGGDK